MSFQKIAAPVSVALILGLAWWIWSSGRIDETGIVDVPKVRAPNLDQGEGSQARTGKADSPGRDGLLHPPRFLGRILDDRDLAYANVEVQLCCIQEPLEVLTHTQSLGSGEFELRPNRSACSHRYRLRARAGAGFPWVLGEIIDPLERDVVRVAPLRVPRPAEIQGQILDLENRPVPGAEILFSESRYRHILGDETKGREARSGPDGRFRLSVPPGTPFEVRLVNAILFEPADPEPRTFQPGQNRFVLRVRPIPDSGLKLRFWTWQRSPHPGVRSQTHPASEEGVVKLEACSDQVLPSVLLERQIRIPPAGWVDVFMPRGAAVALQPGPLLPGTSRVQVRFEFLGSSTEGSSGRTPAHPLSGKRQGSVQVAIEGGRVHLQELRPGRWRFWIRARGWPESRPVEIDLEATGLRPLRKVTLVGPAEISGTLLRSGDMPASSQLLRLYSMNPERQSAPLLPGRAPTQGWLAQVRTDSHGQFRFLGLPLVSYAIWARNPDGMEIHLAKGRLLEGQNPHLRLRMDPRRQK